MRPPTTLTTLIACLLLLALAAGPARANGSDDRIVQDCQHSATGALTGSYTKAQLNHALHNIPGDVLEYSGCYDAIRQALLASAGQGGRDGGSDATSGGGDGSLGGAGSASGAEAAAAGAPTGAPAQDAPPPAGAERPVELAGTAVAPGALPEIGRDSHRLPTALVVLLALLGLAALAPATLTIGRRVVARRRA